MTLWPCFVAVTSLTKSCCLHQAWEHSVGIICFPSLEKLAEEVSNQLVQEIQKVLVGKPAGKRREVLEKTYGRTKQL